MITKLGRTEEKILKILKESPKGKTSIVCRIHKEVTHQKFQSIVLSLDSLIKKKLIKKDKNIYYFVKDLDVISEMRGDKIQKVVTVPNLEKTKNWKKGDSIKLINLSKK